MFEQMARLDLVARIGRFTLHPLPYPNTPFPVFPNSPWKYTKEMHISVLTAACYKNC